MTILTVGPDGLTRNIFKEMLVAKRRKWFVSDVLTSENYR